MNCRGFSLIEIMVVIGIIAVAMGLGVGLFKDAFHVEMKNQTRKLYSLIKFAYNEAASRNFPYRIVFDLDAQSYWVEEGGGPIAIQSDEAKALEEEKMKKLLSGKEKPEQEDKDETELGPGYEEEENTLVSEGLPEEEVSEFGEIEDNAIKKVVLDQGVILRDVYVAHQEKIKEEGQVYLYFLPSGQTEVAVIHLSDEEGEINYSVVVNPMTGRSRIESEYVNPEELFEENAQ